MKLGVVGQGRVGSALTAALREAGYEVDGPVGRDEAPSADAILLCVPDAEISAAAEAVAGHSRLVGHTSGATSLEALRPAARGAHVFGLHPLQTFANGANPSLKGVGCAISGSTPEAVATAREIAERLGMVAFELPDHKRASYHAAASVASNFLITIQAMAEEIAADAGLDPSRARDLLAPLVRTTVDNWVELGPQAALTGPVARGDEETVAVQRRAIEAAAPDLLRLFDALVERTQAVAGGEAAGSAGSARGSLRTIRSVAELRAALGSRQGTVGLVPTMGFLHEGHLSLIRRARGECDTVVMSLFVNPQQFGPDEDLESYPRDEARDAELAEQAGADLIFAPPVEEVYPDGFSTVVEVRGLTDVLCGAGRPGHFGGVTTVVTKLFNMVGPDVAYFGQKDAQQTVVVKKLVRDLDIPVRIEVCPTVREPDGLALSSRNAYLSNEERQRALGLSRALKAAEAAVANGNTGADDVLAAAREELERAGLEAEYLELRSAQDLAPAARVNGSTLLAVAARVGNARLIDNALLAKQPARPAAHEVHRLEGS